MGNAIRVVKSGDYSLLSNYHLKDKSLSWSAKGLLSTMLAFSGEYTIDELEGLSPNGIYGTDEFAELNRNGYLTWRQRGVDSGCSFLEYTIYEKPINRHSLSDPTAEIMDPEDMPSSLENIDEEEKQKLHERLAIDKLIEKYTKELGEQYSKHFVELVFHELCKRDTDFRERMTPKTFEKVCIMVMKQQEEFWKQNIRYLSRVTFQWVIAINAAFDNIEKGFRKKLPIVNEVARV